MQLSSTYIARDYAYADPLILHEIRLVGPNMDSNQNEAGEAGTLHTTTMRKQGLKTRENAQNHFAPPKGASSYASRDLPSLPPRSNSSSVYDSDDASQGPSPSQFFCRHSPLKEQRQQEQRTDIDDLDSDFAGGSLDEDALALIQPLIANALAQVQLSNANTHTTAPLQPIDEYGPAHVMTSVRTSELSDEKSGEQEDMVLHTPHPWRPQSHIILQFNDELVSPMETPQTASFVPRPDLVSPITSEYGSDRN